MEIRYFLGNKCNLRCAYCPVDKDREDPDFHEENLNILLQCIDNEKKKHGIINKVLLIGGEPTLYHENVLDVLSKIHNSVDKICLVTNGTNIERVLEYAKYSNVHITVSWDGLVNERGFDSEPMIKACYDNNIDFSINYVISNANYDRMVEDIDYINSKYPVIMEKSLLEPIPVSAYKSYYKMDYDKLYKSIFDLYDKYPNIPMLFKRHKYESCPLGDPDNLVIKINNGKKFNGCLGYNDLDVIDSNRVCNIKTIKKICHDCDNDLCKVCDHMIESWMVDDLQDLETYKKYGYYYDSMMCVMFKVIQDVVMKKTRLKYFETQLMSMDRLELLITTDCNFRCSYCYENKTCGNIMSKDVINGVIDVLNLYIKNNRPLPELFLFGGEPLMSGTVDIITYLLDELSKNNMHPKFDIVTNGYELNEESVWRVIERIHSDFGISHVQFSIDNIGLLNDRTRKSLDGLPTFDRTISNLKKLSSLIGLDKIGTNTVFEYRHMLDTIDWIKYIDCCLFNKNIRSAMFSLNQYDQRSLTRSEEIVVKEFYNKICQMFKSGEISRKMFVSIFDLGGYYCNTTRNLMDRGCGIMHNFISIDPKGNIVPCQCSMNDIIGNIKDGIYINDDVYKIFDRYRSQGQFRCNGLDCNSCSYYDLCKKCKACNYENNGNANDCNPTKCVVTGIKYDALMNNDIDVLEYQRLSHEQRLNMLLDIKDLEIMLMNNTDNLNDSDKLEIIDTMQAMKCKLERS